MVGDVMIERRILIGVSVLALLAALAVGLGQAQEPMSESDTVTQDRAVAAVSDYIPIQGRLTDTNGHFLPDGFYFVTFRLYDDRVGGTLLCEHVDNVIAVNDGLFTTYMDNCTASDIDGKPLFLGIEVGDDGEMTPRQAIYPVPYAWTVRPGAIIKGADSYLFVPGSAFVKNNDTDSTRWDMQMSGAAKVYRGATAGAKYIFFPITTPGVLYGQNVTVESITVYYRCENGANNYIAGTSLTKQTDADSYVSILADGTDRTSNVASSYTLNLTTDNVLSGSQGILGLYLTLDFENDTEYIQIGGVRLRLSHQ
jgi:hypothetical protein